MAETQIKEYVNVGALDRDEPEMLSQGWRLQEVLGLPAQAVDAGRPPAAPARTRVDSLRVLGPIRTPFETQLPGVFGRVFKRRGRIRAIWVRTA
jgi:hypothetical protein